MLVCSGKKLCTFTSLFVTLLLTITWLSACGSQDANNGQGKVTIGVSIPTTGDFAPDGAKLRKGYDTWVQVVNSHGGLLGRQVTIDYKTDNDDPTQVTTNYTNLITKDKVDLLFGTFDTAPNAAAIRVASRYGYPVLAPTGQTVDLYNQKAPNFFAISLPIDQYMTGFINYLLALPADQRPQTIALAGANNPFILPQLDAATVQLANKPLSIVLNQPRYADETTDFNPLAQQIVNAKADAVILGSLGAPDCAAFIQAFKQQKYNPKAMICSSGPDQGDDFVKAVGGTQSAEGIFVPNGSWYPKLNSLGNDEFIKAFVFKYGGTGDDISSDSVQAYASGQVLEQAVNKAQSLDNGKIQTALSTGIFDSIQGPVKFSLGGRNSISVAFLYQWQQGHLDPVYPSERALANPEYPKKHWQA